MGAMQTLTGEMRKEAELERARCAWLIACDLAARAVGADVRKVLQTRGKPGRGSDDTTTKARRIACYLATTVVNVSAARLGEAALMDRATIYRHAQWVEDQRDPEMAETAGEAAGFDALIGRLETALVTMALRVVMTHYREALDLGDAA